MPHDSRRLYHKEESNHYKRYESVAAVKPLVILDDNQRRSDERKLDDIRPAYLQVGVVTQAKGSSYIEVGATKVMCSCYGPRQIEKREDIQTLGRVYCVLKFSPFSQLEHKSDMQSKEEAELSSIIVNAISPAVRLDSFPRARVDIFINVLEDGGSALAAALTAASLAVADAGIEMYSLLVAQTIKQVGEDVLVDPTSDEEQYMPCKSEDMSSVMTLGYLPALGQVSALHQKGNIPLHDMTQGILTLVELCKKFYPLLHRCLIDSRNKQE